MTESKKTLTLELTPQQKQILNALATRDGRFHGFASERFERDWERFVLLSALRNCVMMTVHPADVERMASLNWRSLARHYDTQFPRRTV